jgi:GntR family transcriptional regulator
MSAVAAELRTIRPRPVTHADPRPLYRQVEADLRERIESGRLRPGDRLPSEAQLADLYEASKITLRHALANLAADGLVTREPGKGTFVRGAGITAGSRRLTSFTEEMGALHIGSGSRILRQQVGSADRPTSERLHVADGTPVVLLDRLRLGDEVPVGIQRAALVHELVPGLEAADLAGASLYAHLRRTYGLHPTEAEETFHVGPVDATDARLLEVRTGECAFLVERVTFSAGRPFEYVRSVMRGDRYRLRLGLRSVPGR